MRRLPGATCMSYKTSVPASILTKFLGKGKIKNKGVFPPEGIEMETLHEFLVELAKKGMKVHEKVENYIT
jgi:saccharopine dehydrogenase-like NADP-dependent oxidoreductase